MLDCMQRTYIIPVQFLLLCMGKYVDILSCVYMTLTLHSCTVYIPIVYMTGMQCHNVPKQGT